MVSFEELVADFASAIKSIDAQMPRCKNLPPGIGSFSEREIVRMLVERLQSGNRAYEKAQIEKNYPSAGRARCDLVLPGWAIEFKQAGIFVFQGKEHDNWSRTLLHPVLGVEDGVAKSLIGDAVKLMCSGFKEKKAVVLVAFEEDPVHIDIELPLSIFEYAARELMGLPLGPRVMAKVKSLVHPCHQQAKVIGWQIGELNARRPCSNPEWLDREIERISRISAKAQERKEGLDIFATMTVGDLRESFVSLYDMTLRVKKGRQVVADDCRIIDVAQKSFIKETLKISSNAKVGTIEKMFFTKVGLRVQVEWDCGKLAPNHSTMAKVRRKRPSLAARP